MFRACRAAIGGGPLALIVTRFLIWVPEPSEKDVQTASAMNVYGAGEWPGCAAAVGDGGGPGSPVQPRVIPVPFVRRVPGGPRNTARVISESAGLGTSTPSRRGRRIRRAVT